MYDVKELEADLNISNQTHAQTGSCGTRSSAAYGYTFLLISLRPANSVPPVTKRIELIGSGATE